MNYELRIANDSDLNKIEQWLKEQNGETFLCNFDLTKEKYKAHELLIYCDKTTNMPIAYLWLGFGLLEVKKSYQNKGIGRSFINDAIQYIKDNDISDCLDIHCAPETSIPFWKKMGFIFYNDNHAYFIIEKQLNLPNNGEQVEVIVNQYKEARNYSKSIEPIYINKQKAIKLSDKIYLSERIIICKEREIWNGDAFIEILIDNNLIYQEKAKRPEGKIMGIENTINSFIINTIQV